MKRTTTHCDLCGTRIESGRSNGWEGNLVLKSIGNFWTSIKTTSEKEESLELCNDCGNKVVETIEALKVDFSITTTLNVKESSNED